MKTPKRIVHIHRKHDDDAEAMVYDCSASVCLPAMVTQLLLYYTKCSSGFRPANATIVNAIGISVNEIKYARNYLIRKGIAAEDDTSIYIDWERMRTFAMCLPNSLKGGTFAPVFEEKQKLSRRPDDPFFASADTESLLNFFGNLSEKEFNTFRYEATHPKYHKK